MKKYDNFFVPVDDLEIAKKYYENRSFDLSEIEKYIPENVKEKIKK